MTAANMNSKKYQPNQLSPKECRKLLREIDKMEKSLKNSREGLEWILRLAHWSDMQQDTARLNYLLEWLGQNESVSLMPVRDWNDNKDARKAIDAAIQRDAKRKTR